MFIGNVNICSLAIVYLPCCTHTSKRICTYIRCLFSLSHTHTHTVTFSFIETGFLGLWAQSIKAMFCGCLCAATAAVFGFNLSLGIFRRRCKVSDEIEILPIAACSNCPLSLYLSPYSLFVWYTILYLPF